MKTADAARFPNDATTDAPAATETAPSREKNGMNIPKKTSAARKTRPPAEKTEESPLPVNMSVVQAGAPEKAEQNVFRLFRRTKDIASGFFSQKEHTFCIRFQAKFL